MKAKEVMKLLNISRPTLCKYVKEGKIAVKSTPGGQYIYDSDSVYKLLTKHSKMNIIYARVSTPKQKSQLENQVEKLTDYCTSKNINISETKKDDSHIFFWLFLFRYSGIRRFLKLVQWKSLNPFNL